MSKLRFDSYIIKNLTGMILGFTLLGFIFKINFLFVVAIFLIFIGIFLKKLSYWIIKKWLKFGEFMAIFNSRIILAFMFLFVLTPVAIFYRLIKGDVLILKKRDNKKGYYFLRDKEYLDVDLIKPW